MIQLATQTSKLPPRNPNGELGKFLNSLAGAANAWNWRRVRDSNRDPNRLFHRLIF